MRDGFAVPPALKYREHSPHRQYSTQRNIPHIAVSPERPSPGRQGSSSFPIKKVKKLDRKAGKTGSVPYYIKTVRKLEDQMRKCKKCQGSMFPERVLDMLDGLVAHFYACINCGRREDAAHCVRPMHAAEVGGAARS